MLWQKEVWSITNKKTLHLLPGPFICVSMWGNSCSDIGKPNLSCLYMVPKCKMQICCKVLLLILPIYEVGFWKSHVKLAIEPNDNPFPKSHYSINVLKKFQMEIVIKSGALLTMSNSLNAQLWQKMEHKAWSWLTGSHQWLPRNTLKAAPDTKPHCRPFNQAKPDIP